MDAPDPALVADVDEHVGEWRQGDCVLGEQWFVFRTHPELPLTLEGRAAAEGGVDLAEAEVRGQMIATQTCDLVRSAAKRPYVEVCPLVEVDDAQLAGIRKGQSSRHAFVPALEAHHLVADLDRVMTVEKSVVQGWQRTRGCRDDDETRRLQFALARKRSRMAFPDDFNKLAGPLRRRFSTKHGKNSPEGEALRSLDEIRVRAAPSWEADSVELTLHFIRDPAVVDVAGRAWDEHLERWLALIEKDGRFVDIQGSVVTLDDLTAREYVESDRLDLDRLSMGA